MRKACVGNAFPMILGLLFASLLKFLPNTICFVSFFAIKFSLETLFCIYKKIFHTKNIPGRAHLVVFHWFYKGWSHFGPLFGPFLAKYVGLRNEMDTFWGHFFSFYLIFHWFYNRIGVLWPPFLVGIHILARFYKGFWQNEGSTLCKILIFHWFYNEFCPSSRHVFIKNHISAMFYKGFWQNKMTSRQCFITLFCKMMVFHWFTMESALFLGLIFGPWRSIFGHFRSNFGHFGASAPISGPEFFQRPSLRVGPDQPKVNFLNIGPPSSGPRSG